MEPSNRRLEGNRLNGDIEQVTRCLVCDCQEKTPLFQGKDDRYGYPGSFTVVACPNCGLAYLSTRPQATQLAELYQKYYPEVNYVVNTAEPAPAWKAFLKNSPLMAAYLWIKITRENLYANIPLRPGRRILDVGSGAVDLKDVRQIIRHGSEWLAVEVDEKKCRALANAGLKTFLGTIEAFQATGPDPFDYIVLSQVLEHVYQPRQFLDSCRSLLKPGGRIMLSCPNYDSFLRKKFGDRWLHWHIPYHVAHYSHDNIALLAQATGLHVAGFYTYTPVTWFFAQKQIARGLAYNDAFLGRHGLRWGQRLLDGYLAPYHRQQQGDALFADLELA